MAHDLNIGGFLDGVHQRDAIHIAVAPVVAAEDLKPGESIGFTGEDRSFVSGNGRPHIGIVDPFLYTGPREGQQFWMFLYPGSITSLRHDWTHPSFIGAPQGSGQSAQWLVSFAEQCGLPFATMMEAAREFLRTGRYYTQFGTEDARSAMWENAERFWQHFEAVTGERVPEDKKEGFFSCSC